MHELLKHPKSINTVPKIQRSEKLPEYRSRSLENIKQDYLKIKENKKLNSIEKIEKLIDQHNQKRTNVKNQKYYPGKELVQDFTNYFTSKSKIRLELIKKAGRTKKDKLFLTKKIFEWIISTMNCIGSQRGTRLYCDLDDLYESAREEIVDIMKIDKEIDYGIRKKVFERRDSFLILINSDI